MILHILQRQAWEEAQQLGEYRAASLEKEGFIHFSKPEQVLRVANYNFRDQRGLVLLKVDEKLLKAQVKFEGENPSDLFPHLYGPLNLDAVVATVPFPVKDDGLFTLPDSIPL